MAFKTHFRKEELLRRTSMKPKMESVFIWTVDTMEVSSSPMYPALELYKQKTTLSSSKHKDKCISNFESHIVLY